MESVIHYRPTKAIIDLAAIKENITSLKQYLNEETSIIAVVKANAYGHGDVETARAAFEAGVVMVAVATPEEAIWLRSQGVTGEILVMAPTPVTFAKTAAELEILVTVASEEWVKEVIKMQSEFHRPLKIHLKIDSGMGRVGLREVSTLHSIMEMLAHSEKISLDGIFTHFPCADEDCRHTTGEQYELFQRYVDLLPEKPRFVHAANSATALLYPEYGLNAVRFGISMYGLAPSEFVRHHLPFPLKRPLTIETELSYVKQMQIGEAVSYGATYRTEADEWIGTLPIGYADGLNRKLRGQEVLIAGERMPIVGTICMDQCMVKLTKEFPVGEKVVLLGVQGEEEIKVEEWASRLETIPYEIVVSISNRIPRIYQK